MSTDPSVPLTPHVPPLHTNNLLGVALMGLAFVLFSFCDMLAKFLTGEFHPMQIVWTRQLALLFGVGIALAVQGGSIFETRHPWLQVLRGLLVVVSATCFILGVRYVPLADAVAVTFIAPFIVTALSARFLGEQIGWRRWSAVVIGFVGALIVIRPGLGVMHPAVLFVVVAAMAFALRQVLSRHLAASDRTITTIAYTAIVSVVVLSVPLAFFWETPVAARQWALLAAMAIAAAFGELAIIRALEIGQASILAPVHYSVMLWATFWGWLIFEELPDGWTLLGTAIIMATGLYIIRRERASTAH